MRWEFLKELEDLNWFPHSFRNQITDGLQFFATDMKAYAPIIPDFLWVMQQSKTKKVVDLCSGGSGPWEYLLKTSSEIHRSVEKITLTDLYPNNKALDLFSQQHAIVEYEPRSVNALHVDKDLDGVRTLFSSFHHFTTTEATSILQDAVQQNMPICIFEITGRNVINILHTPISTVVLFTKLLFKRPLTLEKILFTYLLPIVPLIYLYDCTISHLRSFSQDELRAMVATVENGDSYEWEIGESGSARSLLKNTFLIGYPKTT